MEGSECARPRVEAYAGGEGWVGDEPLTSELGLEVRRE